MTTTYQQARDWRGPALFSFGFRPFFLIGAIWAAGAMGLWLAMIGGWIALPTAFDSVTWHAHAFLFGYLPAIIAGFLLTAVPNWTGRLPVVGWRLGLLVSLWLIGRIAVTVSAGLPAALVAVLDLSCMVMLAVMIAREIVAGKNWKNLVVLGMLLGLIVGGALFHLEFALGGDPVHGIGLRVGLGAGVMMISVIGGRVVPSFTRNWLVKVGDPARPSPPMQGFDKVVLLVTVVALALWVVFPNHTATAFALTALGLAQALRMGRWCGHRTLRAPLVWVLHLAYAFVPLGGAAMGFIGTGCGATSLDGGGCRSDDASRYDPSDAGPYRPPPIRKRRNRCGLWDACGIRSGAFYCWDLAGTGLAIYHVRCVVVRRILWVRVIVWAAIDAPKSQGVEHGLVGIWAPFGAFFLVHSSPLRPASGVLCPIG